MQTVIVDTDVAIDYLRGLAYAKELMLRLWNKNAAYLSVLSVYELYAGMQEKEAEDTDNFIGACTVELVTVEIARTAGDVHKRYRKEGITLTSIDCLVTATAAVRGHKIATRNRSHYPDKRLLFPL